MGEPLDRSQTSSFNIPASSSRLPVLDGLRAIAILSVVAYHFGFEWVPADLGVSLFFVLSGFLVTRGFLDEYDRTGTVDTWAFHRRRALRIFPAYYVFLLVVLCEEYFRGLVWDPWLIVAGFTQTVNYYNAYSGHPMTSIAHLWALSVLEQSYVIWPWGLKALLRQGMLVVICVLGGVVLVVLSWRLIAIYGFSASHSYLYNALENRVDSIALGGLAAALPSSGYFKSALNGWLVQGATAPLLTLALLGVSRFGTSEGYHYLFGFTIESVLLVVFVMQLMRVHGDRVWSWLDSVLASFLGRISYSIYLWHIVCLGLVNRTGWMPVLAKFALALVVCVTVAAGSYAMLEQPFLRKKRATPLFRS